MGGGGHRRRLPAAAAPRGRRLLSAPADHGRALLPPRRRHEPPARRGPAQPRPHGLLRHRRLCLGSPRAAFRAHAAADDAAGRRVHRAGRRGGGPAHPQAARRLLRARHHGLRRGHPARRHQLDGSDAGADGPGRRAAVRSRHGAVDAAVQARLLLLHGAPDGGHALSHGAPARLARRTRARRDPQQRGAGRVLGDQRLPPHHARHGRGLRARRRRRGVLRALHHVSLARAVRVSEYRHHGRHGRGGRAGRGAGPRGGRLRLHLHPRAAPDGRVLPHAPLRRHPAPRGHVHAEGPRALLPPARGRVHPGCGARRGDGRARRR